MRKLLVNIRQGIIGGSYIKYLLTDSEYDDTYNRVWSDLLTQLGGLYHDEINLHTTEHRRVRDSGTLSGPIYRCK